MSEAELTYAINAVLGLHISIFLGYLSIVSAYLIAAFISGAKLTSVQSITVSTLFVFSSVLAVGALWGSGSRIAYMVSALRQVDPLNPIIYSYHFRSGMVIVCAIGILASLKFMWDIRHSNAE